MRSRTALLSATLVTALLPGISFATGGSDAVAETGSSNLTHVANLPHAPAPGSSTPAKGSDIEFATLDVTGLPDAVERGVSGVREFAVAGTINIDGVRNSGMQIIDITDPEKPVTAGIFECINSQGDVQVFTRPDLGGRTFATYVTDSSGTTSSPCYQAARDKGFTSRPNGTFIVEITNPYAPELVRFVEIPLGSHNQTVHPSGRYLYNSNNELTRATNAAIEYFDITDLEAPKKLGDLRLTTGIDAHDITFNAAGTRAYAAAITHTVIIDTTDPAKPSVISSIVDPTLGIQHQSDPVTIKDPVLGERTFLAVTDEFAGAAGNGWCPGGGVGIYDITGQLERNPVRVGYWNIPEARVAGAGNGTGESLRCTSHVLRFYPEQKLMTIGWYNAGTRVVDISGLVGASVGVSPEVGGNLPMGMREVAYRWFDNSETWASKIHKFEADGSAYVFANDLKRGLDVFKYQPDAPASADGGQWQDAAAVALKPKYDYSFGNLVPLCASPTI
ncbi:MAG TPA: hypothetical protein VM433_09000 [Mycobacteriales bacterium]|nr:hypothetical protein [Mycobacteriales bacterium]